MTENEQRHFEVVLEQILHEVKTVAEGHGALDEKMERFHKEAKEDHHVAMDLIKFSHEELKGEIQGVREELKGEIQGVREEMAAGFKALGDKVNGIARQSPTNAGEGALGHKVEGHEERISTLERKVA